MRPQVTKVRPLILGVRDGSWASAYQVGYSGDYENWIRYFPSWREAYAWADAFARQRAAIEEWGVQ